MSNPEFNVPAFPCEAQGDRSVPLEHDYIQTGIYTAKFPGMSLRDWFAGQALSGLIASEAGGEPYKNEWAAERAYLLSDAMLSERAKATGEQP